MWPSSEQTSFMPYTYTSHQCTLLPGTSHTRQFSRQTLPSFLTASAEFFAFSFSSQLLPPRVWIRVVRSVFRVFDIWSERVKVWRLQVWRKSGKIRNCRQSAADDTDVTDDNLIDRCRRNRRTAKIWI